MSFWIQYPHLTFNEELHEYRWNGRIVPSVTTVFDRLGHRKDDKSPWVSFGCPDFAKRDHDSSFGSAFHKMVNGMVTGKNVSIPDEMITWKQKVERFQNKYQSEPMYDHNGNEIAEYPMYSTSLKICGTVDYVCRMIKYGILWLIDWKSTGIYQKNFSWQTEGYRNIFTNVFGGKIFDPREKIIRATVLFSHDKDEPEVIQRSCSTNPEDKIAFMSLMNTYKLSA